MEFSINPSSRLPICRQLSEQIREAVARGRLQPDERLPSVRELSRSLVVNPNTVARVYGELEHEGILTTRPGLGDMTSNGDGSLYFLQDVSTPKLYQFSPTDQECASEADVAGLAKTGNAALSTSSSA